MFTKRLPYPPTPRHTACVCAALFVLSLGVFLIGISTPHAWNFDEFHYVPQAKKILAGTQERLGQHPPLGPLLIAAGMAMWGDGPLGWRFMSAVFGALTLAGMYVWALVLLEDVVLALFVAALTLVNGLLYVQARIAMLDTFMMAFLTWGMAALTAVWQRRIALMWRRRWLWGFGVMMGLATACKWFGLVPLLAFAVVVVVCHVLAHWGTRMEPVGPDDWYHPQLWHGFRWPHWAIALGVIPMVVYGAIFGGFLMSLHPPQSFADLWTAQAQMYDEQLRVTQLHPYMSSWLSWPWLARPNWYAFESDPAVPGITRGVLMMGNPWVMWGGMGALGVCLWQWLHQRRRDAFLVVFFFASFYLCWGVIPRHVTFYYYYYPAGMVLSLAWAVALRPYPKLRWLALGLAVALFCYFLPILSGMPIPSGAFSRWMWFPSWV